MLLMRNKNKLKKSIYTNLKFLKVDYLYTFDLQNKYCCKKKGLISLKWMLKYDLYYNKLNIIIYL